MLSADPGTSPSFIEQAARPTEAAPGSLQEEATQETHPSIKALKQIIEQPQLHTVGALAALADNLLAELTLFSALCGVAPGTPAEQPAGRLAADVELDFLAAFLRDLDELDDVRSRAD
jgi:hypothetical protein